MAKEIERKFLVTDQSYREAATTVHHITQGYISRRKEGTVRVRVTDGHGFLTVKGKTEGFSRDEWEYEIPLEDALGMLRGVCEGNIVEKERYKVPYGGLIWEVDRFIRQNDGLVVAEVELPSASTPLTLPPFVGKEVSGDPAYYNSNL